MTVITISRELGSDGDKIADLLCQELGYSRVDKALLTRIAEEAGMDAEAVLAKERRMTTRPKLVSSEMSSLYRKDPSAFRKKSDLDDQTYRRILQETMERFAQDDNTVIVGRGGNMILANWPTAIHVRLYAPPEVRVRTVMRRFSISEAEAKQRINHSDEEKRQYVRYMFQNADWSALKYYHLAINTAQIGFDIAAQMIMVAARSRTAAENF